VAAPAAAPATAQAQPAERDEAAAPDGDDQLPQRATAAPAAAPAPAPAPVAAPPTPSSTMPLTPVAPLGTPTP
ncbi:MAG: hypothetical protein ACK4TQ_15875, partial [Hydrogenophaga sp.]